MNEIMMEIIEEIVFRIDALEKYEIEYKENDLPEAAINARNRRDELKRLKQFIDQKTTKR